ncbi:hypothetical protein SDC9_119525 [bioreactor metagenome]|uniref:Uncharacterized protein n=1 Tax=bioreactor metagenome TaxID=1076179 RepID=A0A645C4J1_9ZZZZ
MNDGEFKCQSLTFDEARTIVDMHNDDEVIRCFTGYDLEDIVFNYLGIERKNFKYKHIKDMEVGQDAIAFKLYTTASETQPIIVTPTGAQAKKIQNVYVHCQLISKIK